MTRPRSFERVLVACRGALARRAIRAFREEKIEMGVVFNEADAEQPWVEEADFPQYLLGDTARGTYLDPQKLVSAAIDTGCEALYPATGWLAEELDLHDRATRATILMVGVDTDTLRRAASRFELFQRVQNLAIPAVRCTEDIPSDADEERLLRTADTLGYPLVVRASKAAVARRVDTHDTLLGAVARVREEASRMTLDLAVYLEGLAEGLRTIRTVLVGDRQGTLACLGHYSDSVGLNGRWWVAEMGEGVVSDVLQSKLSEDALKIAKEVGFVGFGSVRWVVTPSGGCYFGGLSVALPDAFPLYDAMLGIDSMRTQVRIERHEQLGWEHMDTRLERHGIFLRLVHVDPSDGSRPSGALTKLDLPTEDVEVVAGCGEGQLCSPESDPVLAEILVTGATRHAALVKARAALQALQVEGVPTNREALIAVLGDAEFWKGRYDIGSVRRTLET